MTVNKVSAKATYITGCRIAQVYQFVTVAPYFFIHNPLNWLLLPPKFVALGPSIGCHSPLDSLPYSLNSLPIML
jgi:hypothetical protein